MKENVKKPIYKLCESAMFIALATALCAIEIQVGVLGGSIDFVMIPLFIIAFRHGVLYGVGSGLVFGLIKCLIGGGIGYGLPSILLDYVLAYGAVGLAGAFKRKNWAIELSTFVGCLARFAIHFISGVTIYMITVPTEVESIGVTFANPVIFSIVYNALYMLPNTVIAVIVMALLRYPIKKLNQRF
ncbi:MAG: energy-coupled thiamine transporter ThiT [Clostridia bacterium]|nr:energy-coupled thiamine transporter ThiT [Clostridia bacterium]